MRTCDETLELISAALDGTLTPEEQTALDEHLAHCPACSALYTDLNGLHIAAGELDELPAPDGFADRVMAHIAADPAQNQSNHVIPISAKKKSNPHWKRWVASAAAVVIVAVGATALPDFAHKSSDSCDAPSADRVNFSQAESAVADMDAAEIVAEEEPFTFTTDSYAEPEASVEDSNSAETDGSNESAPIPSSGPTEPGKNTSVGSAVYCGVLTLSDTAAPEDLDRFEVTKDEQGNPAYVVPAEYFYSLLNSMRAEESAAALAEQPDNTDANAEYGLIIVKPASGS